MGDPGTTPLQKKHVLIVEDDLAIRRLMQSILAREGYDVEAVTDGFEAVLKIGVGEYDAIILDLMMPNLDGFELIATLADNRPDLLPRIVVASAASPAVMQARIQAPLFRMLSKPFDINDLKQAVRECIAAQTCSPGTN